MGDAPHSPLGARTEVKNFLLVRYGFFENALLRAFLGDGGARERGMGKRTADGLPGNGRAALQFPRDKSPFPA